MAKYLNTDVGTINLSIKSFGKRIIDLLHTKEQIYGEKSSRCWNIPFETVPELYHMNKEHWISILLDGTVPIEKIYDLIDVSYDLKGKK